MNRIHHTWDKWECFRSGFYDSRPPRGMTKSDAEEEYRSLLSSPASFNVCCVGVITCWKYSCEHYLTNDNMNRIAWMGQAALAYAKQIPASFRGGYNLLSDDEKLTADNIALKNINEWMVQNGYETFEMDQIKSKTVANLY